MTQPACSTSRAGASTHDRTPTGRQPVGPTLLATGLLVAGVLLGIARSFTQSGAFPFDMPHFWYRNDAFWYAIALAMAAAGVLLLRDRPGMDVGWRPSRAGMRFRRVIVYTRKECPLCDEALAILEGYHRWLPPAETVDIDGDSALVERFTTCVPVVEIDGRVRFRGRISAVLLRRLIEATLPAAAPGATDDVLN